MNRGRTKQGSVYVSPAQHAGKEKREKEKREEEREKGSYSLRPPPTPTYSLSVEYILFACHAVNTYMHPNLIPIPPPSAPPPLSPFHSAGDTAWVPLRMHTKGFGFDSPKQVFGQRYLN